MNKDGYRYGAHCRDCGVTLTLARAEIETGRNPQCPSCGGAMVVYQGTGDFAAARPQPAEA